MQQKQNKIDYFQVLLIMKSTPEIHIVSFNIPYPPNYGGVIDVFFKIKALYNEGILIHLHCFRYDRSETDELYKYCKTVNYYRRPKRFIDFLSTVPFIVKTRANQKLLNYLKQDNYPVIFEGLHTTYFLPKLISNDRKLIVRTHNVEHHYYRELARKEKNLFKKSFFYTEALKLKKYQNILQSEIDIASISESDFSYFKNINTNTFYIPAFHPNNELRIIKGKGNYILYHADLSVNENINAVKYIIQNISPKTDFKFIIAGRNPGKQIQSIVKNKSNIELIANPDNNKMDELIQNAHINLLYTEQSTGIKLKLINSLYLGRHCVVNQKMIEGTGLNSLVQVANSTEEMVSKINHLINSSFSVNDIETRKQILLKNVNNHVNAQKLINLL